jgi:hypothetical protein
LESITTAEDRDYAITIIRALQAGDEVAVVRDMPDDRAAKIKPELAKMRGALPANVKAGARLVDARVEMLTASRRTRLVYAVDDDERHALVSLVIVRMKGNVFLQGLYVQELEQPIEDFAGFQLLGKPWGQYLFLTFVLLSFASSIASLYVLYRATDVPRKLPWAIACALGVGQITMNWNTGQISGNLWAVELFGAMVTRPGVLAPWFISLGVPIGAYVFLLRQAHASAGRREIPIQK